MTLIKVLLSVLYQLNKLVRLKVVTLEEKFPYMIFNEIRFTTPFQKDLIFKDGTMNMCRKSKYQQLFKRENGCR